MRYNKIHIYYLGLALALFALCLPSCIKEGGDTVSADSGDVIFELKMTRSDEPLEDDGYVVLEHEDKIKDLYVLFFSNDNQKDFLRIDKAVQYGLNTDGTNPIYMVSAAKGSYHMVLLANCEETLQYTGLDEADPKDGLTLEDFRMMLTTHAYNWFDDGKWIVDPDDPDFRYMPMWGERENVTVDSDGADLTGPNLVPLIRMVAWIDIVLSSEGGNQSVAANYDLYSVRFYNWQTDAQVIPDENAVNFNYNAGDWQFAVAAPSIPTVGTRDTEPLIYRMSTPVSEYRASIYTFENEKPDITVPGMVYEPMEYPCLVIGLTDKGTNPGGITRADPSCPDRGIFFYRIDFIDNDGNWLDILRNHNYTFTVTKVINQGFPEPEQAQRSWVYGADFKMEWSHGFDGSIATGDGGIYRLDINETYVETNSGNVYSYLSTTHPDGWSAYPSKYPDRIEGPDYLLLSGALDIRIFDEYDSSYIFLPDSDGNLLNIPSDWVFELEIIVLNPGWNGIYPAGEPKIVEEYIHIVAGNLTNVITIRIEGMPQF
ncbi:MAG: FimB/Mfa2 family fimbrial subunit [Alistipes sp.]|nr:FimB/Mfa2 family fimbrial subunit [Alistipes sp.]